MMNIILISLSIILFLTFIVLGGFHFYWLFGGAWGIEKVTPTKTKDQKTPKIPRFATLIVALGLTSFGLIYLLKSGLIQFSFLQPYSTIIKYTLWFIPSIFLIRAIGDFKYVGFFKKVKDTIFAKADSKVFSPLCLFIGVIGFVIQLLS